MADFTKLLVYQEARALAKRLCVYYPRIRKRSRRLADQLERAIESIGDAIAEGRGRATDKDFANFVLSCQPTSRRAGLSFELPARARARS